MTRCVAASADLPPDNRSQMNRNYMSILLVCAALALAGCKNPAADVPAATVNDEAAEGEATEGEAAEGEAAEGEAAEGEAAEGEAAEGEAAAATELALDASNTKVSFVGSKVTASHEGGWNTVTGALTWTGDVTTSSVTINLDMTSLYADDERLGGHLRSEDFFDAANHPTASFNSTTIAAGEGADNFNVTGDLQIKDQTHSVTFPATIKVNDGTVSASAEFSIDRQVWGISYPGMPDDLIRDEVVIKWSIDGSL